MKPNAAPPNPRGKKAEKPTGPNLGGGRPFRWGSPLAYVILLVLGFLLFRNVFQDAGVAVALRSSLRAASSMESPVSVMVLASVLLRRVTIACAVRL